jgi:DNA replication and repair protein RecF
MYLKNLRLYQFKNFPEANLDFSPGVNCLVGLNGVGKTNTLDAIHYLCLTKSAFNPIDQHQILHDTNGFFIKGEFEKGEKLLEVSCTLEFGKKKQVSVNGSAYQKMGEHIGLLPLVMITPGDDSLIRDGSEERRKFFDSLLSQIDMEYFKAIVNYHHLLKNRNELLKRFHDKGKEDTLLIEPFDRQLMSLGKIIYQRRSTFLDIFAPILAANYQLLSGQKEQVEIHYKSDLGEPGFPDQFLKNLSKDILLKRTTLGIHKDDFKLMINGYPIKKFGSQGQQKSFLIGLKLAQFEVFKEEKGFKPLLLLDDIFDKLDDERIAALMRLVAQGDFGQLFLTDARPERSEKIMKSLQIPAAFIHLG